MGNFILFLKVVITVLLIFLAMFAYSFDILLINMPSTPAFYGGLIGLLLICYLAFLGTWVIWIRKWKVETIVKEETNEKDI